MIDREGLGRRWQGCVDRFGLRPLGATPQLLAEVEQLILATCHSTVPRPGTESLIVDIDLSILGAEQARFDEYDAAIRQEYAWVDATAYREGRRSILQGFLDRPHIYATPAIRDGRETRARENLKRALSRLADRPGV